MPIFHINFIPKLLMRIILCFLILQLLFSGCGSDNTIVNNPGISKNSNPRQSEISGAAIYKKNCRLCHGADGELGLSGAANLAISSIDRKEAIEVISNGRMGMTPYKDILSKAEIAEVSKYIMTLRDE